ncbi:hypothetical protein F383_23442 [Gossypium arboreum]|uniref:Uncharacterized protein n=1 Tax=Gossypium arboreum TaxID=29729 RepID=A0A0B0NLY8_GOSAR|nr:hypothetical protein F383_23442 [Gossypium arboreum]
MVTTSFLVMYFLGLYLPCCEFSKFY